MSAFGHSRNSWLMSLHWVQTPSMCHRFAKRWKAVRSQGRGVVERFELTAVVTGRAWHVLRKRVAHKATKQTPTSVRARRRLSRSWDRQTVPTQTSRGIVQPNGIRTTEKEQSRDAP